MVIRMLYVLHVCLAILGLSNLVQLLERNLHPNVIILGLFSSVLCRMNGNMPTV